ncbi:MAG: hypothetical protein GY842_15950 [bacterium]|nr:hypothetical protein [bacterium]
MDGRVLWYKPGALRGCLISGAGRRFSFGTPTADDAVHGGAQVEFKVSENAGELVAVSVRVVQSCLEILQEESQDLASQFHQVVNIEDDAVFHRPQPTAAAL